MEIGILNAVGLTLYGIFCFLGLKFLQGIPPFSYYIPGGLQNYFTLIKSDVQFDDIIGSDEIKDEIKSVIDGMTEKTNTIGFVFYGEPGTGKTMMVKALVNYTSLPCIQLSDDIVQSKEGMFRLIKYLKKYHYPAIIIFDDDNLKYWKNDFFIRTINGIEDLKGFIFIITGNKLTSNKALYRSGRFDRVIKFVHPDLETRKKYYEKYGGDAEQLALITEGLSFADLKRPDEFESIRFGKNNNYREIDQTLKERIAYHEIGHMLISALTGNLPQMISIERKGDFFGHTHVAIEREFFTYNDLCARIAFLMAGSLFEKHFLGESSTLSLNDIKQLDKIYQAMEENQMVNYSDKEMMMGKISKLVYQKAEKYSSYIKTIQKVLVEKGRLEREELYNLLPSEIDVIYFTQENYPVISKRFSDMKNF